MRFIAPETVIRAQFCIGGHPLARLMSAISELELQVSHASVARVKELMLQDIAVTVPHGLQTVAEPKKNQLIKFLHFLKFIHILIHSLLYKNHVSNNNFF